MVARKALLDRKDAERKADMAFNEDARRRDYPASADRALWRAVIAQAMDDACSHPKPEYNDTTAEENAEIPVARQWLTDGSEDFDLVCDLADLGSYSVKNQARRFQRMGWNVTRAVRAA